MAPVLTGIVRFIRSFALRPASNFLLLLEAAVLIAAVSEDTSRPLATPCIARAWADNVSTGIGGVFKRVVADDKEFVPKVWIKDMREKTAVLYFQKMAPAAWMEEQIASVVAKDFACSADSIAVLFFISMVGPFPTLYFVAHLSPALPYARSSDLQVLRLTR